MRQVPESRFLGMGIISLLEKIQMEFEQMVDALEFKLQPKVFVEYSSTLRAHLGLFRIVWAHLGLFRLVWAHLGLFGIVWAHLSSFGLIWAHLGLFCLKFEKWQIICQ